MGFVTRLDLLFLLTVVYSSSSSSSSSSINSSLISGSSECKNKIPSVRNRDVTFSNNTAVACAPEDIKIYLFIQTLVDGGQVRLLPVQQGAVDGHGLGVLVRDVHPQAGVLHTVRLPHVLPHLGQLVGPHLHQSERSIVVT